MGRIVNQTKEKGTTTIEFEWTLEQYTKASEKYNKYLEQINEYSYLIKPEFHQIIHKLLPKNQDYYSFFIKSWIKNMNKGDIGKVSTNNGEEGGSFKIYGDKNISDQIWIGMMQFYSNIWEEFLIDTTNPKTIQKLMKGKKGKR